MKNRLILKPKFIKLILTTLASLYLNACNNDTSNDNQNIKSKTLKSLKQLSDDLFWQENNCIAVYQKVIKSDQLAYENLEILKKDLAKNQSNIAGFIEQNIEPKLRQLKEESEFLKKRCASPDYDSTDVSLERPAMLREMLNEWRGTIDLITKQLNDTPKRIQLIKLAELTNIVINPETQSGKKFKDCMDEYCPEMVVISSGDFQMGATNEEHIRENVPQQSLVYEIPQHAVKIEKPFAIAAYETTIEQFKKFQEETGWEVQGCRNWEIRDGEFSMWYKDDLNPSKPGYLQTNKDPVVCVRREDGREFAKWLSAKTGQSYRLPSEAEWEYAARGGTTSTYYWGNDSQKDQACKYANVLDINTTIIYPNTATWSSFKCNDNYAYTAPVGQFLPNAFGLYDMSANAREWVDDCWHKSYERAPSTARTWGKENEGLCNFPILRGGAWIYNTYNVRIAYRNAYYSSQARSNMWGFRVVRDIIVNN